jgi:hypothetical protein
MAVLLATRSPAERGTGRTPAFGHEASRLSEMSFHRRHRHVSMTSGEAQKSRIFRKIFVEEGIVAVGQWVTDQADGAAVPIPAASHEQRRMCRIELRIVKKVHSKIGNPILNFQ